MKLKRIAITLLALAMIFSLAACGGKDEPKADFVKVVFDTDGGSAISSMEIKSGQSVIKPEAPVKEGYTFEKWVCGDKDFDFSSAVTEDITLKAVYTKIKDSFTVVYDTDGGSAISSVEIKKGQTAIKPEAPVKEGYTFEKWICGDADYDFSAPVTEDITLKAVYTKIPTSARVSFDTDGGSAIAAMEIKKGQTIPQPEPPVKEGFVFVKWVCGDKDFDFSTPINEDISLKAVYKEVEKPVKVSFDTDGGSAIAAVELKKGQTVAKPAAPTKEGYTFVKWVLGDKDYDFAAAVNQDITLKAVYKETNPRPADIPEGCFKIHFNSNGGSEMKDAYVKVGETYEFPDNPYLVGSAFNCWRDKNGKDVGYLKEKYKFDAKDGEVVELTAEWLKGYFTLRFHAKGGNVVHDVIAKENTYVTQSKARIPKKSGCGFLGWYLISNNVPNTTNEKFQNSFSYYGGWSFECSTDGKPIILEAHWETGGITVGEKYSSGSGYRTHVLTPGMSYLTDYEPSTMEDMGTALGWYNEDTKEYYPANSVVSFPNAKAGDVILLEFKWKK